MEQAKRYFIIFLILCGAVVLICLAIGGEIAKHSFIDSSYSGVVKEKVYKPNQRGFPDVLIDSIWHDFSFRESDVNSIVEVGDSIVKRSGTSIIVLYRKDSSGFWVEVPPIDRDERYR